jgi:hypothetical protein
MAALDDDGLDILAQPDALLGLAEVNFGEVELLHELDKPADAADVEHVVGVTAAA